MRRRIIALSVIAAAALAASLPPSFRVSSATGVYSEASGTGNGLEGSNSGGGTGNGVQGTANNSGASGVYGNNFGTGYGVAGRAADGTEDPPP